MDISPTTRDNHTSEVFQTPNENKNLEKCENVFSELSDLKTSDSDKSVRSFIDRNTQTMVSKTTNSTDLSQQRTIIIRRHSVPGRLAKKHDPVKAYAAYQEAWKRHPIPGTRYPRRQY